MIFKGPETKTVLKQKRPSGWLPEGRFRRKNKMKKLGYPWQYAIVLPNSKKRHEIL